MNLAIKEAKKSLKTNDVPVGAIIVDSNGVVVARSHNIKEKNQNVTNHAELIAISKANRKLDNWHLDGCTIYVTLEPCMMCTGAIVESRITKLVYGTSSPKYGYVKSVENISNDKQANNLQIVSDVCQKECEDLLINFFKTIRS